MESVKFVEILFSSFAGAFCAFCFVRLGEMGKAIFDRKRKGNNALVKLQYEINGAMEGTSNNLFVVEFFQKMKEDYDKTTVVPFVYNRFTTIPFKTDLLSDLVNLDYINKLYGFFIKINRLNQTMEDTNIFHEELKNKVFKEGMPIDAYLHHFNMLMDKINELEKFLKEIEEDVIRHLAYIAILIEHKKAFFIKVLNFFCFTSYPKNIDALLKDKIEELTGVYHKNCEENKKRIEKIMKKDSPEEKRN